nr:hypothetical protein [Tanacetum cinerariifolium]
MPTTTHFGLTQDAINELISMYVEEALQATIGVDVAYAMMWKALGKLMNEMVQEEEDRADKYIGGLSDNIQGNVIAAEPIRLQDAIRIANNLMDQKLKGYAIKNAKNKKRFC